MTTNDSDADVTAAWSRAATAPTTRSCCLLQVLYARRELDARNAAGTKTMAEGVEQHELRRGVDASFGPDVAAVNRRAGPIEAVGGSRGAAPHPGRERTVADVARAANRWIAPSLV